MTETIFPHRINETLRHVPRRLKFVRKRSIVLASLYVWSVTRQLTSKDLKCTKNSINIPQINENKGNGCLLRRFGFSRGILSIKKHCVDCFFAKIHAIKLLPLESC